VSGNIKISKDSIDNPTMGYILGSQIISITLDAAGDQENTFSISFVNEEKPIAFSQYDYIN
jgi:hypothetical protein